MDGFGRESGVKGGECFRELGGLKFIAKSKGRWVRE